VFWLTDRQRFAAAVIIYGVSALYTIFLWRQGFRKDDRVNFILLLSGAFFHTSSMIGRGLSFARCPVNNLYEATVFITWAMVVACLIAGFWKRLRYLGVFASPVLFGMGVFALMPALDEVQPELLVKGMRSMHAALTLLACGSFGLSAVAGAMFLTQDHNLKFNKLRAFATLLPPIQRLDLVASLMMRCGFGLLSWGIITGSLWLKETKQVYYKSDPIIHWTILIWIFYLVLLILHWKFGQRGRRFAWATIGAFVFILLTFWGFYLLSPVHHS
jgi:ABC-type uncharacterized transport system permease subunit